VLAAAGQWHTLLVLSSGQVVAFGCGGHGRLGVGGKPHHPASPLREHAYRDHAEPVAIEALRGKTVVAISAGSRHSAAVTDDGAVWVWGSQANGRTGSAGKADLPAPARLSAGALAHERAASVACGDWHTVVVTERGPVVVFGWGVAGQLGLGNRDDCAVPALVDIGERISGAACGGRHTLLLSQSGRVYACGWGRFGQLGLEGREDRLVPTLVTALRGLPPVTQVAAAQWHSAALLADGSVMTWGWRSGGAEQDGPPARVSGLPGRVTAIASGGFHNLALTAAGTLVAWGRGGDGQLGLRSLQDALEPKVVLAPAGCERPRYTAIAAGWNHSVAIFDGQRSPDAEELPVVVGGEKIAPNTVVAPANAPVPVPAPALTPAPLQRPEHPAEALSALVLDGSLAEVSGRAARAAALRSHLGFTRRVGAMASLIRGHGLFSARAAKEQHRLAAALNPAALAAAMDDLCSAEREMVEAAERKDWASYDVHRAAKASAEARARSLAESMARGSEALEELALEEEQRNAATRAGLQALIEDQEAEEVLPRPAPGAAGQGKRETQNLVADLAAWGAAVTAQLGPALTRTNRLAAELAAALEEEQRIMMSLQVAVAAGAATGGEICDAAKELFDQIPSTTTEEDHSRLEAVRELSRSLPKF
jgi:alpha-tubulin suppressor-like RCC1 family protein